MPQQEIPVTVNEITAPPTTITCNGRDILVPHNLEKALLRIRRGPEVAGKKFWIDAVSINQTDDEERSSQVKLMAAIYSSADSVLIWLGEEDDGQRGMAIDKPGLQPIYGNRTVESAYISAAMQILKDSDDLFFLYCVEGEAFQYSPELPSRVPDWRCKKPLGLRVAGYRRFNPSGGLARRLVVHASSRMLEMDTWGPGQSPFKRKTLYGSSPAPGYA
ncbi:hypothetical protein LX36DRAFT_696244 [Colletotrichum falcatum]|nr:hypothetical protein LX36DRAFT_696244 [Colletotrichum falcatum]